MKVKLIFILLVLPIFFFISYILSDTLYLKNGGTIEGIVVEEGDYYVVNLGYGTASFHKSTVSEVKYSSSEEQEGIKEEWAKEKPKPGPSKTPEIVTGQKKASEEPRHLEIGKPGERVDITNYIVKDKITIFDFYSPYCGPCMRVAPRLERLVQTRDDIVVRKININRPSVQGIDWDSPVVKQYNIKYVPYFKIYNERGSLELEGESASDKVYSWLE